MALNDKKLQRLDQLLSAFDTGAVQPDELIKAIDAVIAIIDANGKTLVDTIVKNKSASDEAIAGLKSDLKQAKTNLESVISAVRMSSESNVDKVRANLLNEIKRVESLIPELPPETDLSEVFEQFESQREELKKLGVLVVGENIRNALESLNGEERLDVSAIKGIDELIEQVKSTTKVTGAAGVRLLRYLADVNIDGIENGETLVWNATTGKFEPGAGGGSSLPDQTGNNGKFLTTDGTDPSWATLAGGGDMAAATYDPQAIAADAFDTDNHTDGTTNKVFTATEKTKLTGIETNADVTDTANVTAAGALMDSEVTNLAQVKAFDSADYATAAQGTKVDFLTVTQAVDLDQMETDIAALANGMVYKGDWDASAGTFPGAGAAQTGWFYYVTVGGTVDGVEFTAGDNIVATTDNASTTVYAANWSKHDQTDAVQSVAGLTGSIAASTLRSAINVEDGADVTDSVNVGSVNAAATSKTTPVNADSFPIVDSEASNVIKRLTFTNLKVFLKTYFDTLYLTAANALSELGITATATELNYTDGVTSNIQTQLDGKADISTSINAQTGTTYTLVLADANKNVTMSNAAANTLTVPPNASVAFPVGTKVLVTQSGAGATTIAAGAGVTINNPATVTLAIDEQHESRACIKVATDTWTLI